MEIHTKEEGSVPTTVPPLTVAVAISGSRKSKYALRWALEKFVPEGMISFKILHVGPKITMIPTPMGNSLPISKVREDVVAAYRKEIEWHTNSKLDPFKQMCTQKKVDVEVITVEEDDIAKVISEKIASFQIDILVIGSSSRSIISRRPDLSRRISDRVPNFCTVYVVSKGKLSSIRSASLEEKRKSMHKRTGSEASVTCTSSFGSSTRTEWSGLGSSDRHTQLSSLSLVDQHYRALSTVNDFILNRSPSSVGINHSRNSSIPQITDFVSPSSGYASYPSTMSASDRSFRTEIMSASDQPSTSDTCSTQQTLDLEIELEKLRIELGHAQKIFGIAQKETTDISLQVTRLADLKMKEADKLKEMIFKEDIAKELAQREKEKRVAAEREAEFAKDCAENELIQRRDAEIRAEHELKEKENMQNKLERLDLQYKKFSWEEIASATSSFSDSLRIGSGSYGTVYKCKFHHTTAAVKVLQLNEEYKTKQFHQELEVLSRIRHPHLLLLLGACPDRGCLVYEFMENGSLEDRLFRKCNTPPLPWFVCFRIAWEVASALFFLHNSKPKPIVHRDLKPANILLDHNFVSKIGDVGLSILLPTDPATMSTVYKNTALVGTLCYIDPQYQRTGLVSPKSDVYALGMVILQLVTAKRPMGLAHIVEKKIMKNKLEEILDTAAGEWPTEETQEFACLGLRCAELRHCDRPDLGSDVLPMLERLKGFAERLLASAPKIKMLPPSHFICPILQDVMQTPCVAADGYTYEQRAIEKWLTMNDKSPMTNLPLPNKNIIPNYTLLGAIKEWRSKSLDPAHGSRS